MGNWSAKKEIASASGAARQKNKKQPWCQGSLNLSAWEPLCMYQQPILSDFDSYPGN